MPHSISLGNLTFVYMVTAPTCTEDGYTTYTCSCGDTYVADAVYAPGHSHQTVVKEPTCNEGGFTTYTCRCDDRIWLSRKELFRNMTICSL